MEEDKKVLKIKKEIFQSVKKYYEFQFKRKKEFKPGITKINYAGRVFDDKELITLVDSSLEFWLTEGKYANLFREEFSNFLGVENCILTNSGSSANLLAISALRSNKIEQSKRLKEGDEIITVAAGFPTTIFPIIQNNLTPVFIDIDLGTYNVDTTKLNEALSNKSKAVFLAHTMGNPLNIEVVKQFCEDNDLWLIEDNCDALGSLYKNQYTGTFGDISTFSFYPAHHITMGEGGALLTNNTKLSRIINSLREWGRDCWCPPGHDNTCQRRFAWNLGTLPKGYDHKYIYSEFGYNLKITDMQAAIGFEQLKKLPKFIEIRRNNHRKIYEGLKDLEEKIILPVTQKDSNPSWFGFVITLKDERKITRTKLIQKLEQNKIQTRLLFAGNIINQPVFNEFREKRRKYRIVGELKNTDTVMKKSFWIGVYPGLTYEMIEYIIKNIKKILE
jgi:CDP-6-deoxy-D-xylo-4-hexulose-3-dehydrase